jgi:hypothetical protein
MDGETPWVKVDVSLGEIDSLWKLNHTNESIAIDYIHGSIFGLVTPLSSNCLKYGNSSQ